MRSTPAAVASWCVAVYKSNQPGKLNAVYETSISHCEYEIEREFESQTSNQASVSRTNHTVSWRQVLKYKTLL